MRARVERFTEPAILLLLRDGPTHGYDLLERLPELFSEGGQVDLGNLYRLLRALELEGLVNSEWQTESSPPRRMYALRRRVAGRLGWLASSDEIPHPALPVQVRLREVIQMNGCMCGCGGWGYGPAWTREPSREERIERLEEHQRDLEQRAADVADEIRRLKDRTRPAS